MPVHGLRFYCPSCGQVASTHDHHIARIYGNRVLSHAFVSAMSLFGEYVDVLYLRCPGGQIGRIKDRAP